ncbi:MAG: hypothetical protein AYK18_09675 [Theionarchaea archaeon DG-70]|nr:MAG: hypothetical protein AYK18_09675 [Theionarchaea archaeon DG-70]
MGVKRVSLRGKRRGNNIPLKKRMKDINWGKPLISPPYAQKDIFKVCLILNRWYLFSMHEPKTLAAELEELCM